MRIRETEEFDKLIEGHHKQLQISFSILGITDNVNEIYKKIDEKIDFSNVETLIKYYCFITSSFLDLLTNLKGFLNSKTDWEIIYFSKKGFLTVYETVKTYNYYQENFKKLVKNEHLHLLKKYNEINVDLKQFKRNYKYDTRISTFRNKAAGHYDKDFLVYYRQVESIDRNNSIVMIEDFLDFLKKLMLFLHQIVSEMEEKGIKK